MKTETATETGMKKEIDSRRESAASVLDRAGGMIRERSQQAAELIDKGGSRAADALHGSAERVQPRRNVVRRHPKRNAMFLAFALMTAVVAFLLVRSQMSSDSDDDDLDF